MRVQATWQRVKAVGETLYVSPAPMLDVMMEQLEYLATHRSGSCAPGCVECTRLAYVQRYLLEPFRTDTGAAEKSARVMCAA